MAEDVSGDVAGLISNSKVFGGSDNIRHGHYKFLITRIFAQKVEGDKGQHRMAFWELTVLECSPNPQTEGDRVDYVSPALPGVGPLKDDGNQPNIVGSKCGLKVDFDGPGGRSAGSNIKAAILGLFGKNDGEIPDAEVNKTWLDLSLGKDLQKGECYPGTNIQAPTAKRKNPACGMVIYCDTMVKRKKTPNEKGAFVTKLLWSCKGSPPGIGENAPEFVAQRAVEIEAARVDDEEEETSKAPGAPGASAPSPYAPQPPAPPAPSTAAGAAWPPAPWKLHTNPQYVGNTPDSRWYWDGEKGLKTETELRVLFPVQAAAPTPPTPPTPPMPPTPPTPPTPPAPAAAAFPPAPWKLHTNPQYVGNTPETRWYWDGGQGLKTEADLRAGR